MKTTTQPKTSKTAATQSTPLTRDERFWTLFQLAYGALHSQFEQLHPDGFLMHTEGQAEFERSRTIGRRAWNSAVFGCQLFEEQETAQTFNSKVTAK
jgi:hypothetical protein